jgi:hypothetical protein
MQSSQTPGQALERISRIVGDSRIGRRTGVTALEVRAAVAKCPDRGADPATPRSREQIALRTAGKTKYGLGRTFGVVLDLILIRFLQRYAQRPIHFFGRIGFWSFAMAFVCFIAMVYFK